MRSIKLLRPISPCESVSSSLSALNSCAVGFFTSDCVSCGLKAETVQVSGRKTIHLLPPRRRLSGWQCVCVCVCVSGCVCWNLGSNDSLTLTISQPRRRGDVNPHFREKLWFKRELTPPNCREIFFFFTNLKLSVSSLFVCSPFLSSSGEETSGFVLGFFFCFFFLLKLCGWSSSTLAGRGGISLSSSLFGVFRLSF